MNNFTRRTFFKGIGAFAIALSLPDWTPGATPPEHWLLEQSSNFYDGPWEEVKGWRGKIKYDATTQPEGNLGALLLPHDLLTKPFCRLRRSDREMNWIEQSSLTFYNSDMLKRMGRWGKENCLRG